MIDAEHIHDRNSNRLAGGRSRKGAEIGAASSHTYPDFICIRDDILNRQMKIWETGTE